MGGTLHPILGYLGVMSAKNTAVNILILTTFMSFLLYRRTGKRPTVSWARIGNLAQFAIFAAATGIVIFFGVYGYFVEAAVRIGFSVPQVGSVLFAMVAMTAIDIPLMRGAEATGETHWGQVPAISQYCLIFIAVTFTWLMGLMGYVRSGLRPALARLRRHAGHLGRRLHADARLRHAGRLAVRAAVLRADRARLLAREPARQAGLGRRAVEREQPAPHTHDKVPASS